MFTECNCSMDRYLSCLLRLLPAMSVYLSLSASLSLFLTAAIVSAFKQRKYVNMPLKTPRSLQSSCGEIFIIIEDTVSLESNMQQCNKSTHTLHTRIYICILCTHMYKCIFFWNLPSGLNHLPRKVTHSLDASVVTLGCILLWSASD